MKAECDEMGIPCKVVLDSSVGLCISQVDCVFVGSEAVLENGGIVNKIGTFTIALCAKAYNKPFYVFAESLKFFKRFPLQQDDVINLSQGGVWRRKCQEEPLEISGRFQLTAN